MSDFEITAGATSRRIPVWLADSSSTTGAGLTGLVFNSAGLTCYYWRENEGNVGATAVTLATATRGTFASGGFVEKDATNMPGAYEFGIPDAALATGAKWVKIMFKGATNLAQRVITVKLTSFDLDAAAVTLAAVTHTGAVIPTVTAVTNGVTVATNNDKTGYGLSAAAVQAIWDALTSALTTVGSIGKLLVDNINATISSRSSHSAADVWASATRTITGTAAGAITAASHAAGAIDAASLATDAVNEIADGLLDRNLATGTDSGSATVRTVRQAFRALRNRVAIAAGTATIYKEDDTTASWTSTITTAAGNPISESNPADA